MMNFDLWTLLVVQLFGGFWLAAFGIAALLFILMAVFGRMSTLSTMNYLLVYFLAMSIGYGYRWLTVLIGFLILLGFYISFKNYFSG